jgi:hypothetical protein
MSKKDLLTLKCNQCRQDTVFQQPYLFHAGFGDQGFLYNDAGTLTLVWGSYDQAYAAIVGQKHPWDLEPSERRALEARLRPAPSGGRWAFANQARCVHCAAPISGSILQTIYYVVYPGSVRADASGGSGLAECLEPAA